MSVRKRTWITPKGEEKTAWVANYTDSKGVRRLKTFAKKKDADSFAAMTAVEIKEGTHVADSDSVTVKKAGELWIASGEAEGLEPSSIEQRKQHLKYHIEPLIGAVPLPKITVPAVRQFQDDLRDTPYPDDFPKASLRGEKRSAAIIKRATVSLGSLLSDAQERGLVVRNAVHEMSKRRKGSKAKMEKRQKKRLQYGVDIPTREEVAAILRTVEGRYRPLLITAVFTGLRASELRGLSWSDVDFDKAQIHVRQRADKYHVIGMPKSDAGQRTVPLTPMVVNSLKEWKLACPKGDLNLVFPNGEGNVEWHQNIINRGLLPTLVKAGVAVATGKTAANGEMIMRAKYTGLHALRHWFASWCINRKADGGLELSPKAVQTRMGHSSIQITFDTYGHLFPAADEAQALADAESMLLAVNAT
jgi:integrase